MSEFWDTRYAQTDYTYGTEPNEFLRAQTQYLKLGLKALAVGDGEGRNGVWLAQQGLDVVAVDSSGVGLQKALALAKARGVTLRTEQADLLTWHWPVDTFDIVAAIFVHFMPSHRIRMHHAMFRALKPGGVLIMEAFTPEQLNYTSGGPPVKEMLFTKDMLQADFAAGEIISLEDYKLELHEGRYHDGPAAVVRLIVRK